MDLAVGKQQTGRGTALERRRTPVHSGNGRNEMSDELTQVVAELRALVATQSEQLDRLQRRVLELEGPGGEQSIVTGSLAPIKDTRVSRRNLLGKAGATAAGVAGAAVVAGVLAGPAAAATGDPVKAGQLNEADFRTS